MDTRLLKYNDLSLERHTYILWYKSLEGNTHKYKVISGGSFTHDLGFFLTLYFVVFQFSTNLNVILIYPGEI